MWRFSRSRRDDRPAKGAWIPLGEEVEAFVHGHLGASWGGSVEASPWLQVNRLAHGSLDDLRATAEPIDGPDRRELEAWRHVLARLSTEILLLVDDEAELRQLQAEVLWPLEGEMIAAEAQLAPRPGESYRLVHGALAPCRDACTANRRERPR